MAPAPPLLVALVCALGAPPAAAQVPGVEVPTDPAAAEIPHGSAISEQYRAIEDEVSQAVPVPPAPPAAAPEPETPAPEPAPTEAVSEQYHSETPDVSVSQDQPSNVNVSIRINSPGDNGPVVQVNSAGGGTTVEHVVEPRPSAPPRPQPVQPPRPPRSTPPDDSGGVPETWEWVWTSACFGDVARAAAAVRNWSWRWSCDEDAGPPSPGEADVDVLPGMPDPGTVVGEVLASTPVAVPFVPSSASARARGQRVKRSDHAASRARRSAPAAVAPAWNGGAPANAARLAVATASMPIAVVKRVREVVRTATQARPGRDGSPGEVPPPLGGATAIGTNALSAVASVLLGLWIAVLTTALVLVIPRLRRRRRSGPAWRLTRGTCSRLERPG